MVGSKKMRFVGKKALFGPEIVVSNSVDYRHRGWSYYSTFVHNTSS